MGQSEREMQILENATQKYFASTIAAIKVFNSEKEYVIQSEIPIVNGKDLVVECRGGVLNFKTSTHFHSNIAPINYQDIGYGFGACFDIKDGQDRVFKIPDGASGYQIDLKKGIITGNIDEITLNLGTNEFFRAVYPLNESFQSYIQGAFVKCEGWINRSLIGVQCKDHLIEIFSATHEDNKYLVIDMMAQGTLEKFVEIINAIIWSFGFLSGCIQAGERYIVQSNDDNFDTVQVAQFRRFSESIMTDMKVMWPFLLHQYNNKDGFLQPLLFSKLVTNAIENKQFLRALVIICEAHTYSLEIRAAAYSVALETMKNIIIDENEVRVSPFKDKQTSKRIRKALVATVNSFPIDDFVYKEAVLKRIEQINQPGNADAFKLAFHYCGVKLNEDDEQCLRSRNDFLHGRLPFEGEDAFKMNKELKYITIRMHHLVSILILKYIGFSGYVLNIMKLVSNVRGDKLISEDPFREI